MGGTHRGLPEPPGHHPQPRLVPGARGNYNSQGTRMQFGRCWEAQAGLGVSRLGCRDPHTPGALSPRGWRSRSGSAGLAAAPAASAGAAPRCAAAAPAAPRPETRLQGRRRGTPSLRHPEAGPPTPAIAPAQGSCLLALHALQPGGNLLARRPWPTRRRPGTAPRRQPAPDRGPWAGGVGLTPLQPQRLHQRGHVGAATATTAARSPRGGGGAARGPAPALRAPSARSGAPRHLPGWLALGSSAPCMEGARYPRDWGAIVGSGHRQSGGRMGHLGKRTPHGGKAWPPVAGISDWPLWGDPPEWRGVGAPLEHLNPKVRTTRVFQESEKQGSRCTARRVHPSLARDRPRFLPSSTARSDP